MARGPRVVTPVLLDIRPLLQSRFETQSVPASKDDIICQVHLSWQAITLLCGCGTPFSVSQTRRSSYELQNTTFNVRAHKCMETRTKNIIDFSPLYNIEAEQAVWKLELETCILEIPASNTAWYAGECEWAFGKMRSVCALLGFCAAQNGAFLPTIRNNLSVPPSRVKQFSWCFSFFLPVKCGDIISNYFRNATFHASLHLFRH